MTRRCVVVLLGPVGWAPPGIEPARWRRVLAEDVVDLLSTLAEVDTAVAAGDPDTAALAEEIRWPQMRVLSAGRPVAVLRQAAALGYEQAAVVAPDVPDLPAMLLGKLLRPLTSRSTAAAPVSPAGPGLIGLASRLPVPAWLVDADPDLDRTSMAELQAAVQRARGAVLTAGRTQPSGDPAVAMPGSDRAVEPDSRDEPGQTARIAVADCPGWHRLRGPADLERLDPQLEGWDATRALLAGR